MTCRRCGNAYNEHTANSCPRCGLSARVFCEMCGEFIYTDNYKCPCCGFPLDVGDIPVEPIRGQSMRCECCGKIMSAYGKDMTASCRHCGAEYVNNGISFSLVKRGNV